MAIITWVGQAQAVADAYRGAVTAAVAGTSYGFDANGRTVRYTAVTGDTTADVAQGIVTAAGSGDARIGELTVSVNESDATKFDVVGASNGRPITGWAVTAGVTGTTVATATGPRHASNVLNYSSGALPVDNDTLRFSGLTRDDGPAFDLTALTGVDLDLLEVLPDYLGSIGLPDVAPNGYTEFRDKFLKVGADVVRILSSGQDTNGRFRIDGDGEPSSVYAYGAGAQLGVYGLHLTNYPTGSALEANAIGVHIAPDFGQAATFDGGVTALGGAVLNLSERVTTVGALVFDSSSGLVDCTFATLTTRNASSVLSGPNADCSTATGIAVTLSSGALDWRSQSVPAAEVTIGTDASLTTKNALGPIPAFICHMYQNSTLDDGTGRITFPHVTNLVQCSPEDVTIIKPEHIKATWNSI